MRFMLSLFIVLCAWSCAPSRVSRPSSTLLIPLDDTLTSNTNSNDSAEISHGSQNAVAYAGHLKFLWPMRGEVVDAYGRRISHVINRGLNIKTSSNENVVAAEYGEAVYANNLKGWGKTVVLKHANSFYTVYANLKDVYAREGGYVKRGELLGKASESAENQGYVLHFELRRQRVPLDPLKYLSYN